MRKVFLPVFLTVMLLPAIVLAKTTALPNPGEKAPNVKASGSPRAPDQDWITLLGGQTREFKADADGKLRFPVNLTGVKPDQISLRLRDVRLGQRGDTKLRDYFAVSEGILQDPQQGPAIEVVANLDKDPPQGTYDLSIEASTSTQPHPRNLELKVVHPTAKIKPIDKVVLQRTQYPLGEPKLVKPNLALTETSGNSRLKPLKLVKPVFSGVPGEICGGGLDFPDFPGQIPAGGNFPLTYNLTGDFPLGSFTGNAQITSPQLVEPVTIQFEVKNRLGSWIIILLLISGLAIGWLSRTYLTFQVELDQARLAGGRVLAQLTGQTNRIPDKIFAEKLQGPKEELETVLMGNDPKAITDKATEADQKLRDSLKDFDERRAQVQAKMVDFIKLFDTPWFLPPAIQGVLTAHRNTLTEAQNKLANKDVEGARSTQAGDNQAVSGGLEADLRKGLMQPVADWKGKAQNVLGILSQPNLPLPAPVTRTINEGVPLLNGLLAKVEQVQPQDQMPQMLYEFLHSTVREYLAAKYLLENGDLQPILQHYWHQPKYEQVLAFALSMRAAKANRGTDVVEALTWLISYGAETYQQNPQELLAIGRSPLRTALHLVRSAGLVLADLEGLAERLQTRISVSGLRQLAVACDSRTPDLILQWLSEVGSKNVQKEVAGNPNAPPEVLKHLAEVGSEDVQSGVAENPHTPPEVLKQLAEVERGKVQTGVATNPHTPPEVLKHLIEEGDIFVQKEAAANASMPPGVLKDLAEVGSEDVQTGVAYNPNTPTEVLKRLAEVGSSFVQNWVAKNPNTILETL